MWNDLLSINTPWLYSLIPGHSLPATIIAIIILIIFSAGYSGTETGLYRMNRLRLHMACRQKNRAAMILDQLLGNQQFLISVFLICNNLVNYLLTTTLVTYLNLHKFSDRSIELITALLLTPFVFIFGETVPKMCFYARANSLMLKSVHFIRLSYWFVRITGLGLLMGYFSQFMIFLANRFSPANEMTTHDWNDLGVMLRENLVAGPLSKIQGNMAEKLLQLPSIRLTRVLTPLQNTMALPLQISRQEFIEELKNHAFARIPLYQGTKDNIVGVVSIYEVLTADPNQTPASLIQPVQRINANENVLTALNLMKESAIRLAIVTGRQNKPIGIITINDLLDEIMAGLE
jgi:CBS domain containing-hemolysin-like protein